MSCWQAHPGVCATRDAAILPDIRFIEKELRRIVAEGEWYCLRSDDADLVMWFMLHSLGAACLPWPSSLSAIGPSRTVGESLQMRSHEGLLVAQTQWHIAKLFCSRKSDCTIQVKTCTSHNRKR